MPKQKNPAPKPIKVPEQNSKAISVTAKDEAEAKKRIAALCLSPEMNAARIRRPSRIGPPQAPPQGWV